MFETFVGRMRPESCSLPTPALVLIVFTMEVKNFHNHFLQFKVRYSIVCS